MKKYLSNKNMYKEIIWCKGIGKMTPELSKMIELICRRLVVTMKYTKKIDYEDAVQEGILRCHEYWYKYDEDITDNPFAYFTQIAKHAFYQFSDTLDHKHYKTGQRYVEYRDFDKSNLL